MNLQLCYDKVNNLEGRTKNTHTLCSKIQAIFQDAEIMEKSDLEVELMMSLYFFYADQYLKDWIQKKQQNWVGIFREKTILCQPIGLLASRPQQSTNNLKTFQDNTTF
jgi:hypothetical protein